MRLIDADELRKLFYGYYACINENAVKENYRGDTLMDYEVVDMIEDCIDNTPTIEAEPIKHGKWIRTEDDGDGDGDDYPIFTTFMCSECKAEFLGDLSFDLHYCPNCGTRMDGIVAETTEGANNETY